MQTNYRLGVLLIVLALNGCASFYEEQTPAPVFGQNSGNYGYDPYGGVLEYPSQPVPPEPPVLETRPLEGINKTPEIIELKPELPPPIPPSAQPYNDPSSHLQGQQPDLIPEQPADNTMPPIPDQAPENPAEIQPDAQQTVPQETVQAAQPEPPPAETFSPLEQLPPQTPAVNALVLAANDNTQAGNLDSAVSSIERAIRIEPRNAALYYKLALIRLDQSKPRLAEDLARKAALLAVNDNNLKKHSWLLIANAREQQQNVAGASEAKAEAAKY